MACITHVPASGDLTPSPPRKRFRNAGGRRDGADMVARQARITLLAFQMHDARDAALAFLNDFRPELNGRPIDVAGADDDGLAAAIALLRA